MPWSNVENVPFTTASITVTHYVGVWSPGTRTDSDVKNGTGAVLMISPAPTSIHGEQVDVQALGLGDGDYELEWYAEDENSFSARGAKQAFTVVLTANLTADDIEATGQAQSGFVTHTHSLAAETTEALGEIQTEAVTHTHSVVAKDIEASGELQIGAMGLSHVLVSTHLDGVPYFPALRIEHTHAIVASDTEAGAEIYPGAITHTCYLTAVDIEASGHAESAEHSSVYGISAYFTVSTGTLPLYWYEECEVQGKFGPRRGKIFIGSEEAVVTEWYDSYIRFQPLKGALVGDTHDLHVDRVI